MDKIEKIKKWVQKQMELYWKKLPDADDENPTQIQLRDLGQYMAYENMEIFLDSLQEEAPIDLEEEVIRLGWSESVEDCNNFHLTCGDGAADINDVFSLARHFYELGKNSK